VKEDRIMLRHALALSSTASITLALAASCAETPNHAMQPDPGTGYTVETTGADVVARDAPSSSSTIPPTGESIAERLAAQLCDREVRCHAAAGTPPSRSADECWRASLGRARSELLSWRCTPGGARARAEECLASIGSEACEYDVGRKRYLCASNAACGADATLPPSAGLGP
jgi:hypothetical protein